MEEGFEEVPGDDGVEVDFVDFVGEDGVVVFPGLFDTEEEVFDGVCVFESIESGPVDEFVVEGLCGHVVFNFKLFLDDVGLGEAIGELGPLVDLVEVVVI